MKPKKLRIAIFHCGFIYSGGGERIVLEEARGLIKKGVEVSVYAPTLDPEKCFPDLVKKLKVKTFLPQPPSFIPGRFAFSMILSSIMAPFFAFKFKNVDLFLGANQPGAWIAFCVAVLVGKPYIVYMNQPNRLLYPRKIDKEVGWTTTVKDYHFLDRIIRLIKPFIVWTDKVSYASSKAMLVNGGFIKKVIEDIYKKPTINSPAGSYHAPFKILKLNPHTAFEGSFKINGIVISKPYLLITNRHDPQKRFDYVIRAMKIVLKKIPDVSLIIPGSPTEETEKLINLAKDLNIDHKIIFLGQISEKQLQKLYQYAAVYCYPSPEEDFGLGPLEAGGWGVPTVAWDYAGPTVTVLSNKTGLLARPYSVKDYAEKVIILLKNPNLRSQMGRASWERTKNDFSWDNHINILEEEIRRLI